MIHQKNVTGQNEMLLKRQQTNSLSCTSHIKQEATMYNMATGNFLRLVPLFNGMSQNSILTLTLGDAIGNSWWMRWVDFRCQPNWASPPPPIPYQETLLSTAMYCTEISVKSAERRPAISEKALWSKERQRNWCLFFQQIEFGPFSWMDNTFNLHHGYFTKGPAHSS